MLGQLRATGSAIVHLDLKPDLTLDEVGQRLSRPRGAMSWPNWLTKRLRLPPAAPVLLREAGLSTTSDPASLAATVKDLPIRITGTRPIAEAISSGGGIERHELDHRLMLTRLPGVFAAGEMLDWEAPTGGFLLQACFATGVAAAEGALAWLTERAGSSPHAPNSP